MPNAANGPDLTDCEMMMRSIEGTHGGHVVLTVFPEGIGAGIGLRVNLTHLVDTLPETPERAVVGVSSIWPCKQHREFWHCVYDGLYKLDYAIGKSYIQLPLKT